jgi:hypothetical protein
MVRFKDCFWYAVRGWWKHAWWDLVAAVVGAAGTAFAAFVARKQGDPAVNWNLALAGGLVGGLATAAIRFVAHFWKAPAEIAAADYNDLSRSYEGEVKARKAAEQKTATNVGAAIGPSIGTIDYIARKAQQDEAAALKHAEDARVLREQMAELAKAGDELKTQLNATVIDKEKLEASRQHLQNWLEYMFPMFNAAVENDILGSDTLGNIQRLLTDSNLSAQMRIAAVMEHFVMYRNDRKPINGQLNSTVTLSGGTVSLDIPDVKP